MANAPAGAVIIIASTAIASIRSPEATPAASGIPPTAACTVALGIYARMQNNLSFIFRLLPIVEI